MNEPEEYYEEDDGPRQTPWYLITGLILGLGLGLLFSLVISPVRYVDTAPAALAGESKNIYRLWIAQSYQSSGNLERARQRLALLQDSNVQEVLAAQAQLLVSQGEALEQARALAELADALNASPAAPTPTGLPEVPTSTPEGSTPAALETLSLSEAVLTATVQPSQTPAASPTPLPSFTPRRTPSPVPTLGAPFTLASRSDICDPGLPLLLQVELRDSSGQPVPGVRVSVAWEGGLDAFFTGLKPGISAGYADFQMETGVVYSLRAGENGETINDLTAPTCTAGDGTTFTGGLYLEFFQP